MGAAIVRGDDFKVLVPTETVPLFVFDAGIREAHVPVLVRQAVLARPPRDLFGLTIRPPVTVLPAAIALVEEPLIVALELIVQGDSPDPSAVTPESFLSAPV